MELELASEVHQEAHEVGGVPPTLVARWWPPLAFIFGRYFSYFLKSVSVKFQVIPRTFISAQK